MSDNFSGVAKVIVDEKVKNTLAELYSNIELSVKDIQSKLTCYTEVVHRRWWFNTTKINEDRIKNDYPLFGPYMMLWEYANDDEWSVCTNSRFNELYKIVSLTKSSNELFLTPYQSNLLQRIIEKYQES